MFIPKQPEGSGIRQGSSSKSACGASDHCPRARRERVCGFWGKADAAGNRFFRLFRYKALLLATVLSLVSPALLKASSPAPEQKIEILGYGAAMIDHYFLVSDQQLSTITNEKGNWQEIDYTTLSFTLEKNADISKMIAGGSAGCFLKGMSHFGRKCAMIGKIGNDQKAAYYLQNFEKHKITSYLQKENLPTGEIISLITQNGEATYRSYLGSSHAKGPLPILPEQFEGVRLLYVEGYQLIDQDLLLQVLEMAKKKGLKIAMNLGNVELARKNKEFILQILPKYVDLLFCREKEAKELFDLPPNEVVGRLSKECGMAAVLTETRGVWVQNGQEKFFTPSIPARVVNITGELDMYACGFIQGYLEQFPLQVCSQMGTLLSTYVVKMVGAEIAEELWGEILPKIEHIKKEG